MAVPPPGARSAEQPGDQPNCRTLPRARIPPALPVRPAKHQPHRRSNPGERSARDPEPAASPLTPAPASDPHRSLQWPIGVAFRADSRQVSLRVELRSGSAKRPASGQDARPSGRGSSAERALRGGRGGREPRSTATRRTGLSGAGQRTTMHATLQEGNDAARIRSHGGKHRGSGSNVTGDLRRTCAVHGRSARGNDRFVRMVHLDKPGRNAGALCAYRTRHHRRLPPLLSPGASARPRGCVA